MSEYMVILYLKYIHFVITFILHDYFTVNVIE